MTRHTHTHTHCYFDCFHSLLSPTGAKLTAGRDADKMLSMLVTAKIVNTVRERKVSDLHGEFNYLGTAYQNSNTAGQRDYRTGDWIPQVQWTTRQHVCPMRAQIALMAILCYRTHPWPRSAKA